MANNYFSVFIRSKVYFCRNENNGNENNVTDLLKFEVKFLSSSPINCKLLSSALVANKEFFQSIVDQLINLPVYMTIISISTHYCVYN